MQGVFIGYALIFALLVGILIGWYSGVFSERMGNNKNESPGYSPSIDEILSVLNVINMSYRCSPHEKECLEKAICILEEKASEENEEDE